MSLDDKRLELPDLARLVGIHPQTLLSRIQTGLNEEFIERARKQFYERKHMKLPKRAKGKSK